jgi:hypothetical protein
MLWCGYCPPSVANRTIVPSAQQTGANGHFWSHRCGPYRPVRQARHIPNSWRFLLVARLRNRQQAPLQRLIVLGQLDRLLILLHR